MLKKNFEKSLLNNQVKSEKWNVQFDAGRNARGKIGFVLIPNEQTIEKDMLNWAPKDVGMYFSRAIMPHEISTSALAKCKDTLAETAKRILPDDKLDVICFACTSGAVAVGEDVSMKELLKAHPQEVESFRGGKTKLQGFFVGQLMKKTGGKADPKLVNQILNEKLKG